MGIRSQRSVIDRFARYDHRTELRPWHGMALASFVPATEKYVFGIDCADRWLFRKWGTKLVLTEERVVAFRADPADLMKRTHWLEEISEMKYDTGLLTDELRLIGADFYGVYTVPKQLGREFADAIEDALGVGGAESIPRTDSAEVLIE